MSLKLKTIYGFIWTAADAVLIKGLSFIAMLILARWLGPADFGLIGMIAVFMGIGRSLVDSGMTSSIIRTPNTDHSDYTTVFYMNMAMSILVYALLYFSAPWIASFYQQEVLIEIIRIYCLILIVGAFSAVQLAIITKDMKFRKLVLFNTPSTIIGATVGLSLGYYGYGVWSIVLMHLSTQLFLSFLLWINSSWKPKLEFSKEKMGHHYSFGYKIMLSGLIDILFKNSYNVIIGKFFPVQTLGHYERAKRFNDYPSVTLTGIIDRVTYPMLSKLQDDTVKLSSIYRRLLRLSFFVISPLMLGCAAIATPLFELVLGEMWLPAVPFFRILTAAAILYPVHAFNLNILKVYGRSDLFLRLEIIKKSILLVGILIGFQFGIYGLVWSGVFTSVISLLINTHYSSKFIDYSFKHQLRDMLPILLLSGLTFIIMFYAINYLEEFALVYQIILASLIGIFFFLIVQPLYKTSPIYDLLSLIKNRKL